jgi:flagellar L-ring protein precursor FlgH
MNISNKTLSTLLLGCALITFSDSASAQARNGSIFNAKTAGVSSIADKVASRPGDLITVMIQEEADVNNTEASDFTKSTALDYEMSKINILGKTLNPLPTLGAASKDGFSGSATYTKKGSFSARLTAIVMDVLPNGNMVIEGRREVRIDGESKVIEFSGILRRWDITSANTIDSELVAEAKVTYSGKGPLTTATNRTGVGAVFHDAISWLWPF